ncbi:uncharacterized protein LOC107606254 isoform X3 [Arachis ipaensis]|uniref:uncharacterized protein LOC107606254 isoform X3 n=1 Tax=Arachis ipaensis TaxID=130454 RepID=UPI000A2B4544|nr:uncharacterized protein LOC107606254 isoform X3 [Arachis ipaensis]
MANAAIIAELNRNTENRAKLIEEIVKLERKIFPKHESYAAFFDNELKRKNAGLLYLHADAELVGYVMYSWPSSLYASITKLAGAMEEARPRRGTAESSDSEMQDQEGFAHNASCGSLEDTSSEPLQETWFSS